MMKKQHLIIATLFYVCAVIYLAITTPISPHEAKIFYTSHDTVSWIMHFGQSLLEGVIGVRLFFILFGFISIVIFYLLSRGHFKKTKDAYIATLLFMFLPGILTASTLANVSIIVLPLVLLFVLMYEKNYFWILPLIMLALFFIHEASMIFFAAILIFSIVHKDKKLAILSAGFLFSFVYLAKGIEIGGRPAGHFAEIFGLYATVFSPLLFLYFFYAMYRILLRGEKSLLWYISFTALAFSLLLSIRQRVYITDFAPYVMVSIILMLDVFNHSIHVRLPQFQLWYKRGFYAVLFPIVLTTTVIIFHQLFFYWSNEPTKHFAKRIYVPYLLAQSLHSQQKECYESAKGREIYQLRYYKIQSCKK